MSQWARVRGRTAEKHIGPPAEPPLLVGGSLTWVTPRQSSSSAAGVCSSPVRLAGDKREQRDTRVGENVGTGEKLPW